MTNDTWGRVRNDLLQAIGKDAFKNWIEPLEFVETNADTVFVLIPYSAAFMNQPAT